MKILEKAVLRDGYGADGLSIMLIEFANGYGVYHYSHAEDRYYLVGAYRRSSDALDDYRREASSFEKGGTGQ